MRAPSFAIDMARATCLVAIYFYAGKLGLHLAFGNASATPVWPPTGIALAATLVFGYRMLPAVLAGAFLVNFTTTGSVETSLGIACGNALEALAGAWWVNRHAGGRECFSSVERILKFTLLAALGSTAISATCGVLSLVGGGLASWQEAGSVWLTWWLGDATGNLVVSPALLLWSTPVTASERRGSALEGLALCVSLGVLGLVIFAGQSPLGRDNYPLDFLCLPALMWSVFRFGPRLSASIIVVLAGVAIWGTLLGHGPFVRASANESLLLLQAYMAVASVMTLVVGVAVAERQAAEDRFRDLAGKDPLTDLANFRRLMSAIDTEIQRSNRTNRGFVVLFLDVDGLKKINDQYGHLAGNRALCTVAQVLRLAARSMDTAGRFGGDEFALVMPETTPQDAWQAGLRITDRLAADHGHPKVSVSLGVAAFPEDGQTAEALLGRADHRQYQHKVRSAEAPGTVQG